MEIAALVLGCCFLLHLLVLFLQFLRLDNNYNQNISIHGGKSVGADHIDGNRLLNIINDETNTLIQMRPKQQVTSSFSGIYIRLYQSEAGQCLDYYLEDQVLIGRAAYGNQAEIQISDPLVSQKHCRMYRRGEQILIQDLGSTRQPFK